MGDLRRGETDEEQGGRKKGKRKKWKNERLKIGKREREEHMQEMD